MTFKAAARIVVLAGGMAAWFGFNLVMGFYTYLWRNSPDHPDFTTGRIAPMYHRHVHIFFVQPWERRLEFYGLVGSLALLAAAAVLGVVFFRRAPRAERSLASINLAAMAMFLGWFVYAHWPLPS